MGTCLSNTGDDSAHSGNTGKEALLGQETHIPAQEGVPGRPQTQTSLPPHTQPAPTSTETHTACFSPE